MQSEERRGRRLQVSGVSYAVSRLSLSFRQELSTLRGSPLLGRHFTDPSSFAFIAGTKLPPASPGKDEGGRESAQACDT